MSQKPRARRMAMVTSRAFAITGNHRETASCFCSEFRTSRGAGRQPESDGGPRAARPEYRRARSMDKDVAHVGRRTTKGREQWRAVVRPMLPGAGPRLPRSGMVRESSFERLILAEVGHRKPQRIDGDQSVRNAGLENEDEIRGVQLALQFAVIGRRVVDHVEVHTRAVRRCLQFFERDLLYIDVDFGSGSIGEEFLDDVVLPVGVENTARELAVEKVERLREVVLNGVAIPAVVELGELRKEVFGFCVLRFVFEVVVVDGFRAPEIVDADDQWPEILEGANGPQVDERQRHGDERDENECDLQVGIGHHRITVGFQVQTLGVVKGTIAVHQSSLANAAAAAAGASRIPAEDPPAVPLKMWLVRAGTLSRT